MMVSIHWWLASVSQWAYTPLNSPRTCHVFPRSLFQAHPSAYYEGDKGFSIVLHDSFLWSVSE